jgi:UDP-GlcNAc:undecaprenyl-phosphate/decaprenyl-phosphate GlcNAc-1-phosphate transferase
MGTMLAAGFLAALLASFAACWLVLASQKAHRRLSLDDTVPGLQKVHRTPVPRIGGFGILAGVVAGAFALEAPERDWLLLFLLAAFPAFAGGFLEDLTRKVSPYSRLLFGFGAAAVAYFLVDARITDLDLPWDDHFFRYEILAFGFTLFAVGGYAHATNIVDGMNGLMGLVSIAVLGAIALVAWETGDERILCAALVLMGAALGFLVWNWPRGVLFAGDGGAYFLGLSIAALAVLLVHRNSEVSPWFALLALWYPVWETVYSMYRRKSRGRSPADADGLHLHTLVYRRIVRRGGPAKRSALTSVYLLALALATIVPAWFFWDETWILQAFAAGWAIGYVWLYGRIARFRARSWGQSPITPRSGRPSA